MIPWRVGWVLVMCLLPVCPALSAQPEEAPANIYRAESAHYIVTSYHSEHSAREIAERMEIALKEAYQKLFPYDIPGGKKFRIRVFRERESFLAYVKRIRDSVPQRYCYHQGGRPWDPKNEIVAYMMPEVPMFQGLYHEGWHHYLRSKIDHPPQWLNEGLGEYVEGWLPDGTADYPVNRGMLRPLQEGLYNVRPNIEGDRYTNRPLAELFGLLYKGWRADHDSNYALSWAACYFLRHHPDPKYKRLLQEALAALGPLAKQSENTDRIRRVLFSRIPPDRIQADFEAFIKELRWPGDDAFYSGVRLYRARAYEPALKEFEKASKADSFYHAPWIYKSHAYSKLGKYQEAFDCLAKYSELYPDNAKAWKELAELGCRCGRYDAALAAADQAINLQPDLKPAMDDLKESIRKRSEPQEP